MKQFIETWLKIIQVIDKINEWTGRITAWLVIPLIVVLTYETISRYIFNAPTIWAFDSSIMIYGAHFMLGVGYTLLYKGHVRSDMIYEKLSPQRQGIIDAVCYLFFFFPGMIFFLIVGVQEAFQSWRIWEHTETGGWRPVIFPYKTAIPVAAVLLILQGLSEFTKSVRAALSGKWD